MSAQLPMKLPAQLQSLEPRQVQLAGAGVVALLLAALLMYLVLPQWRAYQATDTSLTLTSGRYIFGASDSGDATNGSVGGADNAGDLGTFVLRALTVGTHSVTPGANDPDAVFADSGLFDIAPTGGVTFTGDSIEVIPEPSTGLLALVGVFALVARRRRLS